MRLKTGVKQRFNETFTSFAPITHTIYILRHCINIVFVQKNHIDPWTFIFSNNNKIIQLFFDCPF